MTKLCDTCGKEFEISKFQPYVTNCKEHRSKQTIKKNVKKKRPKNHLKECCVEAINKTCNTQIGIAICHNKSCKEQYWLITTGFYRTFHKKPDGKYWLYNKDGERLGKFESVSDMKEVIKNG